MTDDEEDRFCQSCEYLVGRRHYSDTASEWRCHSALNVLSIGRDLVTGATTYQLRFRTCYDARSAIDGCGSDGKWYALYRAYKPAVVGGIKHTADKLLEELDQVGDKK